jgi:hypothetical protein
MTNATTNDLGLEFITRLGAGDHASAAGLLAPDVHFQALTPPALREAATRDEAMEWFTKWFPAGDVEQVDQLETSVIGDRQRVGYRVRWHNADGERLMFEQQAYYEAGPEGITWIHLVCSGNRPA